MKTAFFLIATAMIVVALALLLVPLLRAGRRLGRPRGVFALGLGLAFALPLAAIGLYVLVGTPAALDGVSRQPTMQDIDQAIAQLREHLGQQPGDAQGWALLAQSMTAMRQPAEARDAFDHLLQLDADNVGAMVGWAEADSQVRPDHRIDGRALALLQRSVQLDPTNQRGLWLLGIAAFQADRYAEAAAFWRRLQPLLEPGSSVAQAVAEQIAVADARAGQSPAAPASAAAPAGTDGATDAAGGAASTAPQGPQLKVEVALAPALAARVGKGDTLFVYARAEHGPPMPLAVARLDAAALPATVTLTDAMAMTPQLTLSSVPRVFVGARISRSGQAIAQPGDLEGDAGVVDVNAAAPVRITIDKVH
ncbi:tetratricopeptide repeat protein [Fulvimonas soli]|uniref:Cytochrome c-type biogenesis protein CcmH n=1 Tax=Fulvimonas soli TaxID=155197 RepID=A0A316J085_9GAMM|nr:hypothetical protein [Fulvimonas soli]PWK92915.1 cytochrome c-type biogenesis protein CcmH [Fulvimonas soli]TNY26630.1 hypothetical protein BV497_07845 [Fulvimonas soli]